MKLNNFDFNPKGDRELAVSDYILDAFAAPVRGLEGLAHGVYNLGDFLSFDMLPDWDEQRFFGRSQTLPGTLIEGLTQFAVPFGVIGKGISTAGKAARAGQLTGVTGKAAKAATKGAKPGKFTDLSWKGYLGAEMASDFVAFDGQEERLSNLIQQFPELKNPITEYLAADPDDNEAMGRVKNVLEGVLVGLGVGASYKSVVAGINAIKTKNIELQKGADRGDAITTAMMKWGDETKDLGFADMPRFTDEAIILQKELDQDKTRLDELLKKKKEGKATGLDETRISMLERRIEGKEADLRVLGDVRTADVKERVRAAEEAELQERLDTLDETIEDFEEVGERRPRPFKTYEEEAMMDIIPKGADTLKKRLMKKFPVKGADAQDVADVEKFIDVMGQRLFGDVSLSITNKIPSAGRYNFGNNLLQIRQSVIDEGGIKRTMIHELWHGLSRYLPKADVTALTKQFEKARRDYIKSFGVSLDEGADPSTLLKRELPPELERFLKGKHTSDNYRFKDVDEYFAEEMTDAFLKKLDEGDLAPSGTLKRIAQEVAIMLKDMFASLKAKLGIDQRQKIFNDFLKQRNVTKRSEMPLDFGKRFADLPDLKPSSVVDDLIKDADVPTFRVGGKQSLTGLVKTMGKIPQGMYPQELAGVAEQTANKLLQDSTKMAKMSQEMLDEGVVNELADAMGTDGKMLNSLVQQASKDNQELFRITARMKSLETMLRANSKEILDVAEQYSDATLSFTKPLAQDEKDFFEVKLKTLIEQQLHIQANHSGLASGFGRGLKARQMDVKIGLSEREISDTKLRQDYLNKRGGMTVDNIVENILLAKQGANGDFWNTIIGMNKTVRGAEGGKFMDMVQEYYKNSLMWGPRTLTVNALGGALSSSIKNFERYIGGWFSASPEVKQAVVNSWAQGMQFKDLVRFMLNAWKSGDHYIGDAGSAFVEQTGGSIGSITAKNVERMRGKEIESDSIKQFIDYFGNVIRVPNRFNTSVDQMYKFNEYKMRAVAQLTLKAYELGIRDSEKVAEYVTDSLNALVTRSNRNFSQSNLIKEANETFKPEQFATPADREKAIAEYVESKQKEVAEIARQQQLVGTETRDNDFAALEQLARDWVDPNIRSADEITFSGQLGKNMQKLQSFVNGVPFGFVVAPFIRTPTNILKFSFSRLLAPAEAGLNLTKYAMGGEYAKKIDALRNNKAPALEKARKSLLEQMNAVKPDGTPDLLTRAEARGRLATGTIITTALASVVNMFKDRINGGGPKDFKQRKIWQAAGNMPYSIKVAGKWISYQRLDPIATMIGVFADMTDLLEDGKMHSIDDNAFQQVMAASMLTITRNATNKSYLAGIDNFFSLIFDPDSTSAGKYAGSVIGGFIPNILNQGQSITGDQELKETRTFADVIFKRIPGVAMDLKRNPLGEPVVQEYFEGVAGIVNPLNPIMWGSKKDDPVLTELANVAHGFSAPNAKLEGLINLTNYDGPNDRSAYDRWLELHSKVKINNLTLRQALTKLINSKQYKALDPQSFSGLPSPRVEYLRRVMGRYRQKAKIEMLKEFPEIMRLQQEIRRGKRTGMQREDVLELLTQ